MAETGQRLAEVGVDYLTCTLRKDESGYETWVRGCLDALVLVGDEGNARKEVRLLGFDGEQVGSAFFGENDTMGMLRISSAWADKLFLRTYHRRAHYSRLDVQVTWFLLESDETLAQRTYAELIARNALKETKARLKLRITLDNAGGSTLYIGSRASRAFGRLYNKGAESDEETYANSWRYEVEYHNETATAAAHVLATTARDVRTWIAANVAQWYTSRGVPVPWVWHTGEVLLPPRKRPAPDVEIKLHWLRRQVAPTVSYLLTQVPRDTIIKALGLSEDVSRETAD